MRRTFARFLQALLVVFIAASIAFVLLKLTKGDRFGSWFESSGATAGTVADARREAGYDKSTFSFYVSWLSDVARGDLRMSEMVRGHSVVNVIGSVLPQTLLLMALALTGSFVSGILTGTWQALRNRTGQRFTDRLGLVIISMPDFWIGTILVVIFALQLHWLPAQGKDSDIPMASYGMWLADRIQHLVLPVVSLTLINTAILARYQRAAMRDVIGQQYLKTARAFGVPERTIVWNHALRVAILPMITLAGLFFPALLVGTILIEKVFSWPGMGLLLTSAIAQRDHALVAGIVIVGSAMTALGSFLADTAREWLDPRLRA